MESWSERADKSGVRLPYIVVDGAGSIENAQWLYCTGYALGPNGNVQVAFERDWLDAEFSGDPSSHEDLPIGSQCTVEVRPVVSDSIIEYRSFLRADRLGRFLIPMRPTREKSGLAIPSSLEYHDTDFLASLVEGAVLEAIVVPGPRTSKSISLIPILSAYLDRARRQQLPPPEGNSTQRLPYWPAVVVQAPNNSGWACVELVHRDESTGLRYSFGVGPKTAGVQGIGLEVGNKVLVQLAAGPAATLNGRQDALSEISDIYSSYVWRTDGEGGKPTQTSLRSRRPVSAPLRDRLLSFSTAPQWERRVWRFYLLSHLRRVRSILPDLAGEDSVRRQPEAPPEAYREFAKGMVLSGAVAAVRDNGVVVDFDGGVTGFATGMGIDPSIQYKKGTVVLARVHDIQPERSRLVLNLSSPYIIEGEVLSPWRDLLATSQDALNRRAGVSMTLRQSSIAVSGTDADGVREALGRLAEITTWPAAVVVVPGGGKGKVIGPKGDTIRRLQQMPGVWLCQFLTGDDSLTVIAEKPDELRAVVGAVAQVCECRVSAELVVPSLAANGVLIGKGGAQVRRLREESGCLYANVERGSTIWTLRASSRQAIEQFATLASAIVPGCECRIIREVSGVRVFDAVLDREVLEYYTHNFWYATVPTWLHASIPEPIDRRPRPN